MNGKVDQCDDDVSKLDDVASKLGDVVSVDGMEYVVESISDHTGWVHTIKGERSIVKGDNGRWRFKFDSVGHLTKDPGSSA